MLDGTCFQNWCLLIATNGHYVLDWQWCDREKKIAWAQILQRWPAPRLVVTDGGTGLHAAVHEHWPQARVQRCYFHIFQNVRRYTTLAPRLEAGRQILALTRALMKIQNLDQAALWLGAYASWEARWNEFLRHRTYARTGTERPSSVPLDKPWWYTHRDLRSVRGLFRGLIKHENLFAWLALAPDIDKPLPRTTSPWKALRTRPSRTSCGDTAECPRTTPDEPRNGSWTPSPQPHESPGHSHAKSTGNRHQRDRRSLQARSPAPPSAPASPGKTATESNTAGPAEHTPDPATTRPGHTLILANNPHFGQ